MLFMQRNINCLFVGLFFNVILNKALLGHTHARIGNKNNHDDSISLKSYLKSRKIMYCRPWLNRKIRLTIKYYIITTSSGREKQTCRVTYLRCLIRRSVCSAESESEPEADCELFTSGGADRKQLCSAGLRRFPESLSEKGFVFQRSHSAAPRGSDDKDRFR